MRYAESLRCLWCNGNTSDCDSDNTGSIPVNHLIYTQLFFTLKRITRTQANFYRWRTQAAPWFPTTVVNYTNTFLDYYATHLLQLPVRLLLSIKSLFIFNICLRSLIIFFNLNLLSHSFNKTRYSTSSGVIQEFLQYPRKSLKKSIKIYYFFFNLINTMAANLTLGDVIVSFKRINNRIFRLFSFLKITCVFTVYINNQSLNFGFQKNARKNIKKRLKKKIIMLSFQ